jgi:DNA-binding winged helix-turn-helix (wHTH) protein/tetratricopeptide (TPR) repeat protein
VKRFNEFQLDAGQECLWSDNVRLSLTRKAFAVLNCLVENAGRIVSKDELMEQVWPGTYVGEENLKVHIRELRALLGDRAAQPAFIQTHRDKGYCFIASVTEGPVNGAEKPPSQKLFGRAAESAKLQQLFRQTLNGSRQIVFITGEPGIGKTSLVETFLSQLPESVSLRVGIGQCIESYHEQEAFYPVLEALGRLLKDSTSLEFARLLAVQAPTWLVQFPGAAKTIAEEKLQWAIVGAGRERMLREICESLEAFTAETTLVLVLEDLHWSDRSTLDFVAAVARRREKARLMVLATYRPVEVILSNHPLRQLKSELCTHGQATHLALELLNTDATAEYLTSRSSASVAQLLTSEVQQKTDGNPLFLVALMEQLINQGIVVGDDGHWRLAGTAAQVRAIVPDSLSEAIQKQIEQSTEAEQEILTAASVVGSAFSAAVLAAGLGKDALQIEECCDSLARRHLLLRRAGVEETPDGQVSGLFQFVHALHRDALYHRSGRITRLNMHKGIGEAMETMWRGHEGDIAADLTRHFVESRDYERAVRYLRLQADNAKHRYAYPEAIVLLENAIQLATKLPQAQHVPVHLDTLSQLARIYDELGDKGKAAEVYADVAERAAAHNQLQIQVESLLCLSRELSVGETRHALEIAERAVQVCDGVVRPSLRVNAEVWANFLRLVWDGWNEQIAESHRKGVEWLRDAGESDLMAEQGFGLAVLQALTGDCAGALQTTSEIIPILARKGDALGHFTAHWMQAWALFLLGRGGESLQVLRAGLALAEKNNNAFEIAMGQLFLAELYYEAFDEVTAASLSEQALAAVRNIQTQFGIQRALIMSGVAHLAHGDLELANAYLSESADLYANSRIGLGWFYQMPLYRALAEIRLRQNNAPEARKIVEDLRVLTSSNVNFAWRARTCEVSARIAIEEGNLGRAESEIETALNLVREHDIPLTAWRVHAAASALYKAKDDAALANEHLDAAKSILLRFAETFDADEPLRHSIMRALEMRF